MIDGNELVAALNECGITHVVWIPDSELGKWESALCESPDLQLVRVCREGEAIVLAAGLILGGKRPLVVMQCTGLFEAGDALRNVVHDLRLPLFMIVGVRSYLASRKQPVADTCPTYTEPILKAWTVPYAWMTETGGAREFIEAYRNAQSSERAGVLLLPE
jgi:sulfopyruvate decarboxylase TPP-binding subunit